MKTQVDYVARPAGDFDGFILIFYNIKRFPVCARFESISADLPFIDELYFYSIY